MAVADIIAEPAMYGGYKVPVKGFDFDADSFTSGTVQALYEAYKADPTDETKKALSTEYLTTYYPTVVRRK